MKYNEIYINDFSTFDNFKIEFQNIHSREFNLNLLVGRNGSGKSTFLDALFEIGKNNISNSEDSETIFQYAIRDNKNIVLSKRYSDKKITTQDKKWDKVIRYYTGSTSRKNYSNSENNIIDVDTDILKWCFPSLVFCGKWKEIKNSDYWEKIKKLILGLSIDDSGEKNKKKFQPKLLWIESKEPYNEENQTPIYELLNNLGNIKPSFKAINQKNKNYRFFFDIDSFTNSYDPFNCFQKVLNSVKEQTFIDCGFLYEYNTGFNSIFPDQYLSDGEHNFLNRFAFLQLLAFPNKKTIDSRTCRNTICLKNDCPEENCFQERYLILLDEPETHFNEYWKSEFLYILTEILKECKHDIFIATHSAMLVTDAKKDEVHRFEKRESETIVYPTPINTFGVNVVDIGKALFQMESDIGKRSQEEIESKIKEAFKNNNTDQLSTLLREVGPGEWRWKIRSAIKEIEQSNRGKNFAK